MLVFKVGDEVEAIDDVIKGTVTKIRGSQITIESTDGFTLDFDTKELVLIAGVLHVSNHEVTRILKEKEPPKKRRVTVLKSKERSSPKMEVDLHIQQLTKNANGLQNYEILELQLETARRQLEFAISKRIQKVVFIHGVGEGVLKEELQYLFRKYDTLKFYDADYQKYGAGATEVYFYQS